MGEKENDGRGARKKLYKKLLILFGSFLTIIFLLNVLFGVGSKTATTAKAKIKNASKKAKGDIEAFYQRNLRQGASRNNKAVRGRGSQSKYETTVLRVNDDNSKEGIELILSASVHLVDLEIRSDVFANSVQNNDDGSNDYDGIFGEFCHLNFDVHKTDPSSVPMFRDVIAASPECQEQRYRVKLRDIVKLAKDHDDETQRQQRQVPKSIDLSAVVFHESRVGSTLVANALIAMNPEKHRVYSESGPPLKALGSCGGGSLHGNDNRNCEVEDAANVLRDVIYMMGRTNDSKEERLFFKIQSAGTHFLPVFSAAYPDVPWLFLFRKPVEVMMSHMAGGKNANCLRTKRRPPPGIRRIIKEHEYDMGDITDELYCAAHLAAICEAAVDQIDLTDGMGIPLNYELLPDVLYHETLPNQLGIPVSDEEIKNIMKVSNSYSKNRGSEKKKNWVEDSKKKEDRASDAIKMASKEFLDESFKLLEGEMRAEDIGQDVGDDSASNQKDEGEEDESREVEDLY